jgi:psiF repeat
MVALAVALAFVASTAYAADDKKLPPQQEKMRACNVQATEKALKGDERKAFMTECLKAKPMTQQERMTRKAFMSECLKGEKKS